MIRVPPLLYGRIYGIFSALRAQYPSLYWYPASDMHITALDIQRGREGLPKSNAILIRRYARCIREALRGESPFGIRLQGLTASAEAVLVKGYYEEPLERIRASLRARLREEGLPAEERYETYSCHVSVARFPAPVSHPQKLIAFVEKQAQTAVGSWRAARLELTYHNWYDSQKECLEEFFL